MYISYMKNTSVQKLVHIYIYIYIYIYSAIKGIMRHNSRGCGEREARLSASVIQIIHRSLLPTYLPAVPFSTSLA